MAYPKGDARTKRITVLGDEFGTAIEEEKEALKSIINYVDSQLAGFKKHLIWEDTPGEKNLIREYVWRYYNSSQESVFIQDYLERLND